MKASEKAHLFNRPCFRTRWQLIYCHAANALMWTIIVVVMDVLFDKIFQVPFAENSKMVQSFMF